MHYKKNIISNLFVCIFSATVEKLLMTPCTGFLKIYHLFVDFQSGEEDYNMYSDTMRKGAGISFLYTDMLVSFNCV